MKEYRELFDCLDTTGSGKIIDFIFYENTIEFTVENLDIWAEPDVYPEDIILKKAKLVFNKVKLWIRDESKYLISLYDNVFSSPYITEIHFPVLNPSSTKEYAFSCVLSMPHGDYFVSWKIHAEEFKLVELERGSS